MYAVTGGNGQLAQLVLDRLLGTIAAEQIVAAVRRPESADALRARRNHSRGRLRSA